MDISIWLFQAQAGRGGQNPELRTLFFRLVRLLALPIHPLFVYDGRQKPPFKRGKATTGRSFGSAPIISLSKILIDLFKFPRHDAPGEAEAECARLQQVGVVDAVMSNDVDALMFGSTLTVMNFSKESSSGTTAATHVDCYRTEGVLGMANNVGLSRAGMILFAMLSGGDYLPSGVTKCGSKLAGEIAKAGFGEDLLEIISSDTSQVQQKLRDWRERLQYELDENESGYFQSKHKAVRISDTFPDPNILSFYANPVVSTSGESELLRQRLIGAWDHEIDVLELRKFVADTFDWKYRSGAKKVVRNLAEPLVHSRLRLGRSPIAMHGHGSFVPNHDVPVLQRVYRSRMHYSTDGTPQLQLEIVPIDVVGLDLDAEEPNPPTQSSQMTEPGSQATGAADDEDDVGAEGDLLAQNTITTELQTPKKRYDPYEPEKIWIFESVANLGIPDVVQRWKKQEEEKTAPKKPAPKKGPTVRKKKPIDPGMKPGGILRFTTVTKPSSEMSMAKQSHLLDAASATSLSKNSLGTLPPETPSRTGTSPGSSPWRTRNMKKAQPQVIDELAGHFTMACSISDVRPSRAHPTIRHPRPDVRRSILGSAESPIPLDRDDTEDAVAVSSPAPTFSGFYEISYTNEGSPTPIGLDEPLPAYLDIPPIPSPTPETRRSRRTKGARMGTKRGETRFSEDLDEVLKSLSLTSPSRSHTPKRTTGRATTNDTPAVIASEEPEVVVIDSSPPPEALLVKSAEHLVQFDSESPARTRRQKQGERLMTTVVDENEPQTPRASLRNTSDKEHNLENTTSSSPKKPFVEAIRTRKGFWTVLTREEGTTSSGDIQGSLPADENETGNGRSRKKRVARVSILDMS